MPEHHRMQSAMGHSGTAIVGGETVDGDSRLALELKLKDGTFRSRSQTEPTSYRCSLT